MCSTCDLIREVVGSSPGMNRAGGFYLHIWTEKKHGADRSESEHSWVRARSEIDVDRSLVLSGLPLLHMCSHGLNFDLCFPPQRLQHRARLGRNCRRGIQHRTSCQHHTLQGEVRSHGHPTMHCRHDSLPLTHACQPSLSSLWPYWS